MSKSDQPVVGLGDNNVVVIIVLQILHSEDGVRFVLWQHGQDRAALPEQMNLLQGKAFELLFDVF